MKPDANFPISPLRRSTLTTLAAGAVFVAAPSLAQRAPVPACVLTPEQTEGPYFVDERLDRSDIRADPATRSVKPGVPLALRLTVSAVSGAACRPVEGAIVDVWHCDATGLYSDVDDMRASTKGARFLRGYQVTGPDGSVQFTTIYPGAYAGRAVHIHFKVRTTSHSFTSQLYFDDALSDRIHAQPPYASERRTRNERDGLYRSNGRALMLQVVDAGNGYAAAFDVGLRSA